jgi:putative transposase
MEFVDPRKTPFLPIRSRGELPHLHKPGGFYFVTFRLADAVLLRNNAVSREIRAKDDPVELMMEYDPPLTLGSCLLGDPRITQIVQQAVVHFENERYLLGAWCVMPNHVHAVIVPTAKHGLATVLHSWKSFTAHEINKLLERAGPIWERESFDHFIRSESAVNGFVSYTEENPVAAGLVRRPSDWPFSSPGTGFRSKLWN